MKQVFTLSFLLVSFLSFSQQRQENTVTKTSENISESNKSSDNPRTTATSVQIQSSETHALSYNLEDKYMGREAEFLANLKVSDLPADFPIFKKEISIKEYNASVDAFYLSHEEILKKGVKEKLISSKK